LHAPSPFLIAFVVSLAFPPLAGYSLFYSLLVTEITPFDQVDLPIPSVGDEVSVYGVWVQDTEFVEIGLGGWYEIHPVRYVEINGKPYGQIPYNGQPLFNGVWSPSRLILLDRENPYRFANGTVGEVFTNVDGDYHVHVNIDEEHVSLLRPNLFATSLPLYQVLKVLSLTPIAVIISYVLVSIIKPGSTYFGRKVIKKRKEAES
jgi:hypothetical protein